MSDQENVKPDEENDVEAHKRSSKLAANEESGKDESTADDDVELHGRNRKLL